MPAATVYSGICAPNGAIDPGMGYSDDGSTVIVWLDPTLYPMYIPYGTWQITDFQIYGYGSTAPVRFGLYTTAGVKVVESGTVNLTSSNGWQGASGLSLGSLPGGSNYILAIAVSSTTVNTTHAWNSGGYYATGSDYSGGMPSNLPSGTAGNLWPIRIKLQRVAHPLREYFSDKDFGFVGSPDNTDPFTSGQQVTLTPLALPTSTIYVRVRGIDPAGSNTYGDWVTRSFTITADGGTFIPAWARRCNEVIQ